MEGKIFSWDFLMTTVLFRVFFVGIWENHFGLANFFINLPLKLFNFNFILFFPKKLFWIWILKKKIWLDRRKKYIPAWHFHSIIIYLPFSQYNHIQNFEEKKLFQHFANLIKIRSTHLLPILDLIIPPLPEGGGGYTVLPLSVRPSKILFVTFLSATIMAEIWYLVTSFTYVCHIVGSVFGTINKISTAKKRDSFLKVFNGYRGNIGWIC